MDCSPPGDLSDPGIEPTSLMPPILAGGFIITSAPWASHKPAGNSDWRGITVIQLLKRSLALCLCVILGSLIFLCDPPIWFLNVMFPVVVQSDFLFGISEFPKVLQKKLASHG